jgi:multidrug efflux system outer membrane protein
MPKHFLLLLAVAALAGCGTTRDHRPPPVALPVSIPELQAQATAGWQAEADWWRGFGDPTLDALVQRALDANLTIRLQVARVEEFRARLGLARAGQLPTLAAQASASRERPSAAAVAIPGYTPARGDLFAIAGLLNYEIDLWGRLARERAAAAAMFAESTYASDAIRLSILTDVVTTYFDLRAAQNQLAIGQATVDSRAQTLRLQEIRHSAGAIDELALQQAHSEWEAARAILPSLVQRLRLLEGALGILVGLQPVEMWDAMPWQTDSLATLRLPDRIPDLLPVELLERRPDIRAAAAALDAAHAGVGIARAQRLPRITLSALLGTAAIATGDLFTYPAETWSLGAGIAGPIWDFGRTRAGVEIAKARAGQAELSYRLTVASAFNDVRNALVLYTTSNERAEAHRRLVAALERTQELAELRYDEGFISFMEFLDAQRALLAARLSLEEATRDQLRATAILFKALGGGWSEPVRP